MSISDGILDVTAFSVADSEYVGKALSVSDTASVSDVFKDIFNVNIVF